MQQMGWKRLSLLVSKLWIDHRQNPKYGTVFIDFWSIYRDCHLNRGNFPEKNKKLTRIFYVYIWILLAHEKPPINFLQTVSGARQHCGGARWRGDEVPDGNFRKRVEIPIPQTERKKRPRFRPLHTPKCTTDTLGKGKEGVGGGYSRTPPTVWLGQQY